MGRRFVLLGSAVLIAALGTLLVFLYVRGASQRALAAQDPVQVLVAKVAIPAGTRVEQINSRGDVVTKTMPASAAAEGALSTIEPIKDKVALTTIYPGQHVVLQMFGGTPVPQVAVPIPAGSLAASFQFSDPARVGGFVQPGSQVAVFLTGSVGGNSPATTRLLLPSVQVIAVGPSTDTANKPNTTKPNTESPARTLLTLAVTQQQMEKIVFAQSQGEMYLGLLTESSQVAPGPGVNAGNLFG